MFKDKKQYLFAQRLIRDELSHFISCIIYWRTKIKANKFLSRDDKVYAFKSLMTVQIRFKEEVFELCRYNDSWLSKRTIGYLISNIDFNRYYQEVLPKFNQ